MPKDRNKFPRGLEQAIINELAGIEEILSSDADQFRVDGFWHCPFCATKVFQRLVYFTDHVSKAHINTDRGVSSSKQQRIMVALWNWAVMRTSINNVFAGPDPSETQYIQRSAKIIREQLQLSPSWADERAHLQRLSAASLEDAIVVLLDGEQSRFVLRKDADGFHKISASYHCTDHFLSMLLAAVVSPDTKGAIQRVEGFLQMRMGWLAYLLPRWSAIYTTVLESLMGHPKVQLMMQRCRSAADKRIVGIDGQYSTLLNVLYQTPHGTRRKSDQEGDDGVYVNLTVQCNTSVLLTSPTFSEAYPNQVAALKEGVGDDGIDEIMLLFSDHPEILDVPDLWLLLINLCCLAKDPLHVALRIEKAFGGKTTPLSSLLRKCLCKFRHAEDDGKPFFRMDRANALEKAAALPLLRMADAMIAEEAAAQILLINTDEYGATPYANCDDFVYDVAALSVTFPNEMGRKIEKSTTVLTSLLHSTRYVGVEYLMNISRFASRFPDIPMMYGTTRNEAYHLQLKAFFRNVFQQSSRHARLKGQVATLAKLLAGTMGNCEFSCQHEEAKVLRSASSILLQGPLEFEPKINILTKMNPSVNVEDLPPTARCPRKRSIVVNGVVVNSTCVRPQAKVLLGGICKRPASVLQSTYLKRPASALAFGVHSICRRPSSVLQSAFLKRPASARASGKHSMRKRPAQASERTHNALGKR